MRITTTYFGPAELKNLNITTSRDRQRMYRTVIQAGKLALVANRPNCNWLMHIQVRLIVGTHYEHMYIVLFLLKCVFKTNRFTKAYIDSQSHLNFSNIP